MIRIGIVGCGRILAAHLQGYRLLREAGVTGFEISALCARQPEDALAYVRRGEGPVPRRAVSRLPGDPLAVEDEYLSDFQPDTPVEIHTDYRELIASNRVDAVNDFTWHGLHHEVAAETFARGKALLTQKPLAVSMAAARHMVEEAERVGVTFGVFENLRFVPWVRQAAWALSEDGPVGPMEMAAMGNIGTWWAPDLVVAETPWRHRLCEGGGISLDLGPHFFDLIRHVSGSEVVSVGARTQVVEPRRWIRREGREAESFPCDADDTFHAHFALASGATGTLFGSWAGRGGATKVGEGIVFHGRGGRIERDQITLDGKPPQSLAALYEAEAPPALQERHFPLGIRQDFALAQLDWLRAVERGGQPECSGAEGRRDLACAYAIVESSLARREVSIEEIESGRLRTYQHPIDAHYGLL